MPKSSQERDCAALPALPGLHPWVPIPIALVPVASKKLSSVVLQSWVCYEKKNSQQDVIWYDLECSPNNKPSHLTGAFYVGLLNGLLGVAGIMKLYEIDSSPVDHSL